MFPVQVVLADEKAFQQEKSDLQKKLDISAQAGLSSPQKNKMQPATPFGHSILFELGESGFIARVVICVELFNEADVQELERTTGTQETPSTLTETRP